MLAIPIVAAFQPDPWRVIPILNGLRSPVRSYVVVALLSGVLAGVGIGRLGRLAAEPRRGGPWARLGSPGECRPTECDRPHARIAAYGLTVVLATSPRAVRRGEEEIVEQPGG